MIIRIKRKEKASDLKPQEHDIMKLKQPEDRNKFKLELQNKFRVLGVLNADEDR